MEADRHDTEKWLRRRHNMTPGEAAAYVGQYLRGRDAPNWVHLAEVALEAVRNDR
jgi:hypothetical protein